jgi:hypothetical protein
MYFHFLGCVNFLASCFIEEIIKVLGEKGYLKKQFLEYLITPRLRTLDFSTMCVRNEISDLLRFAANRCPVRNIKIYTYGFNFNFIPAVVLGTENFDALSSHIFP